MDILKIESYFLELVSLTLYNIFNINNHSQYLHIECTYDYNEITITINILLFLPFSHSGNND